jgi:hypothetical protein
MIDGGQYSLDAWETCGVLADMLQDGPLTGFICGGVCVNTLTAVHVLRWINTHRRKPFSPSFSGCAPAHPWYWYYAPPARFWSKTIAPNRYYVPCHVAVYAGAQRPDCAQPETLGGAYVRLVEAMLKLDNETLNKL